MYKIGQNQSQNCAENDHWSFKIVSLHRIKARTQKKDHNGQIGTHKFLCPSKVCQYVSVWKFELMTITWTIRLSVYGQEKGYLEGKDAYLSSVELNWEEWLSRESASGEGGRSPRGPKQSNENTKLAIRWTNWTTSAKRIMENINTLTGTEVRRTEKWAIKLRQITWLSKQ